MSWSLRGPTCVVARCLTAGDLAPASLAPLREALRLAARAGGAKLLLVVDPSVRSVDAGAPGFWLELARDREIRLAALGIVSTALTVRAAARGFALAQEVMAGQVRVEVFSTVDEAHAWVDRPLEAPRPAAPAPPASVDAAAPVVWSQAVEGLARAVGADRDPQLLSDLATLGFDLKRRAQPSYPRDAFLLALDVVATQRWGGMSAQAAMVELGKAWVFGFSQTLVGRTQLAFVHALGPRRAVQRLTQTFRTANNYTDAEARELGPSAFEVRLQPVFRPGFFTGILAAGLEVSGAREPTVELMEIANLQATYRLSWKAK